MLKNKNAEIKIIYIQSFLNGKFCAHILMLDLVTLQRIIKAINNIIQANKNVSKLKTDKSQFMLLVELWWAKNFSQTPIKPFEMATHISNNIFPKDIFFFVTVEL